MSETDNIKRIDIREFRDAGYLQEVNRQFLHPLGLALEVHVEEDGTERLGGVWDYRDDPEGIRYDSLGVGGKTRALHIAAEQGRRAGPRKEALGYIVQPVGAE